MVPIAMELAVTGVADMVLILVPVLLHICVPILATKGNVEAKAGAKAKTKTKDKGTNTLSHISNKEGTHHGDARSNRAP